jgi:hypothetical protein
MYNTTDYKVAGLLIASGYKLRGYKEIEGDGKRKLEFYFDPEAEEQVLKFRQKEVVLEANQLLDGLDTIRDIIFETKRF